MPESSKVHHVYKALLKEGHSEESAARIAQAQTGEALATGKPPKHKEENCSLENANSLEIGQQIKTATEKANAIYKEMQKSPEAYERLKGSHEKAKKEQERLIDLGFKAGNSFQNGRTRALNHIMNRAERAGVKLGNAPMDKLKRALAKTPADDEAAGYKDRLSGFYDKWYRYNRSDDGVAYDRGCKKAVDSGKCPDHFKLIEGYRNV